VLQLQGKCVCVCVSCRSGPQQGQSVQCSQLLIASMVVTGVFKRICLGLKTSITSNFGYYNAGVAERTGVLLQDCRQLLSLTFTVLYSTLSLRTVCNVQAGVLVQFNFRHPFVCRKRFFQSV
jgi:hypothetical protein